MPDTLSPSCITIWYQSLFESKRSAGGGLVPHVSSLYFFTVPANFCTFADFFQLSEAMSSMEVDPPVDELIDEGVKLEPEQEIQDVPVIWSA